MNIKFSALPVSVGDAFLLEHNNEFILVDGGLDKNKICDLLEEEKIPNNHIHVLICTHYDADHINGIIGILESRKWTFKEIWLPEVLGSIGYTISKSHRSVLDALRRMEKLSEDRLIGNNELLINDKKEFNEDISITLLNLFLNFRLRSYLYHLPRIDNDGEIIANLYNACALVKNSLSSGACVRWFAYEAAEKTTKCGYGMTAKNAIETGVTIYNESQLLEAILKLSPKNKKSLVFLFDSEDVNVLFTADSDLSFLSNNQKINLEPNSIVTAPHHGSADNDNAYDKIAGKPLHFVRSDKKEPKRPSDTYLAQEIRYCTRCRDSFVKQKVVLEFNDNNTTPIAGTKTCYCQ